MTRPPIIIARNGHHISLNDAAAHANLLRACRGWRIVSGPDPVHGYRTTRQVDSLLQPDDGMWRANAGLLPILQHVAQNDGRRVVIRASTPMARLPDPVAAPRILDDRPAAFVAERERGLIRCGAQVEPVDMIAQILPTFPSARVAILGTHQPQLDKIRLRLNQELPAVCIGTRIPEDEDNAWIATSTFTNAAEGRLEKCHLVLLVDATHASHQRAEPALAAMDARFRLFGLLPEGCRLVPSVRDTLIGTFGLATLDVPRLGWETAQVQTTRVSINSPPVSNDRSGVALHRAGYWRHPVRNRKIVQLARMMRAGDAEGLSRFPHVQDWLERGPHRPLNVTLLVHNMEHALVLARRLPGWPVVAHDIRMPIDMRCLEEGEHRLLAERSAMLLTGEQQIVSLDAAAQLQLSCTDVIIWAGGGRHAPTIPRHWLIHPSHSNRRLLLIDFTDRHHEELASWSRQRREQCEERDWFDARVNAEAGRIHRFLRQPPRRTNRNIRRTQ